MKLQMLLVMEVFNLQQQQYFIILVVFSLLTKQIVYIYRIFSKTDKFMLILKVKKVDSCQIYLSVQNCKKVKITRVHKIARRYFCTKGQNLIKIKLHGDIFARLKVFIVL